MQPDWAMRSCTSRFVALLDLCAPGDESRIKQTLPSAQFHVVSSKPISEFDAIIS
jgi:hypothetical protein